MTGCWDKDVAKAGHRAKVERRKLRRMKRREKGGGGSRIKVPVEVWNHTSRG